MELPRLFRSEPQHDLQPDLRDWFAGRLGRYLVEREQELVSRIVPELFGYHALQLGQVVPDDLLAACRIRHRCIVDTRPPAVEGMSALQACPELLPFAEDSLDLVFIHHGLDGAPSPHALLREASRVLIPEGHLLIVGFNPWSLWGLARMFRLPWAELPWLRRPLSPRRLADWLALLGFEVVGLESACFIPPVNHDSIRRRFGWLELLGQRYWSQGGAAYVLLARKHVSCMTRIAWQPGRRFPAPAPALVTEARARRWTLGTERE